MKASTLRRTTCEKGFVLESIKTGIRLDGRQSYDYRNIEIEFGIEYGCCEVQLGDTRVLAQTSTELVKPVDTRPTEGQLFLNVELSPMASPAFENGRMSEHGIEINRLIERCLKESRPIDVESLCVVAGEKVWSVRVDVVVLNDNGNILDCSCIAAICALAHFRRPDVTVTGNEVVIHSFEEKEPVPLNIHHMPICCTFGFIGDGEHVIIDPEEKEESILSGQMTLAFNIHGEVCCSQMTGGVALDYEEIMKCANIASIKAIEITELIKEGLEEDRLKRAPPPVPRREGLKDPVMPVRQTITKTIAAPSELDMTSVSKEIREVEHLTPNLEEEVPVQRYGTGTVGIGNGGRSTWVLSDASEDDAEDGKKTISVANDDESGNSEEEITVTLHSTQLMEDSTRPPITEDNISDTKSETKRKKNTDGSIEEVSTTKLSKQKNIGDQKNGKKKKKKIGKKKAER